MTREDSILYAYDHDIPITATKEKVYSIDDNLWGRAIECGEMEDPWNVPAAGRVAADQADGDRAARRRRSASRPGVPVERRRRGAQRPRASIERLNDVVGSYGWGRLDMVENRRVGIKSRETYECPASLALILAHRDLESICLERDLAAREGAARAPLRRARLRRPVVQPAEAGARRVRRREPAVRHRRGAAAPRARLAATSTGPAQPAQPLRLRPGHLRRRRQLPPRGLGRLRAPVGPRSRPGPAPRASSVRRREAEHRRATAVARPVRGRARPRSCWPSP